MTAPELVAYIRRESQAGVSAQELRETLMEAGWSELDVENALHDVAAGLRPVTSGASIHEDLAQVRGLVAHLTERVGRLEARLTGADPVSDMSSTLPSGRVGAARTLPAPHARWSIVVGILFVMAVCAGTGLYLASITSETASNALSFVGLAATMFAIAGWFFIRAKRAWPARFSAAAGIALGAWSTWLAWHAYGLLEWTTALAIGVLLLVYLGVVVRWIRRIER